MEITKEKLIGCAREAMQMSYSPYSHFAVGAALLGKNGQVYKGCNIENASFGATNCAERTALFKAVSEGCHEFVSIAIVSKSGGLTFPCGICCQVLSEFFEGNEEIYLESPEGISTYKLADFLPHQFNL
ncbi:MAG: cytidine deaminase [Eubacteriales bacterium]|nr:cytidine deaminase [Eubacteriales bacterium]